MKRRITPILTITIGLILISTLAHAAKKKEQAKAVARPSDTTSEEKALKAELLDATEGQKKIPPVFGNTKKNVDVKSDLKTYQLESSMHLEV